jgi:hypothetical protein
VPDGERRHPETNIGGQGHVEQCVTESTRSRGREQGAAFKKCAKIRPYLTWSGYWLPGHEEKNGKTWFSAPNPCTNPGRGRVSSFPEVPLGAVGGRPRRDGVANSGPPCPCPSRKTRSIPSPSPALPPQIQYVSARLQSTLQFLVASFLLVYIV